jgi:glycosyltransferase involved in cell wall biosynthesis
LWLLPPLAILAAALKEAKAGMRLGSFPALPDHRLPGLSIVVAARDEAESVGPALASLLEQDYPELEVVLVDDRSSDGTSQIADDLKLVHPRADRLTVIHNRELPEGWLGKVHAMHLGARASRYPLVLFTDADISFSPDALKKAVTAQQVLAADHLAVAPRFTVSGFWEPVLVAYFLVLFTARYRPATVHRKKSRFAGVGAFNLLTRPWLERLEWLEPLRLQVLDDMHLGRMVKARGGRQFALLGQEELSVRWFSGLRGVVHGLEKNAYAGLGYNPLLAVLASVLVAGPFWSILLLGWQLSWGWAAAWYGLQLVAGTIAARASGVQAWVGAAFPLAGLVLAYTMLRSGWLAERRRAIVWRQTRYPLAELRRAQREFVTRERL